MAEKKPIDLSMPLRGFDENWAYKAQPEGTSPSCLNVRPYDVLGQRLRGGQRAGLSKYIATRPNGANPIQMLVQEPVAASGFTEGFAYADTTVFVTEGNPWRHYAFQTLTTWIDTPTGGATAPAWVSATAYKVGDQVTYTGTKYVCVTANSDVVWTVGNWFAYTALANPATIVGNAYHRTQTLPGTATAHIAQFATSTGDMTVGLTITDTGTADADSNPVLLFFRVAADISKGYVLMYYPALDDFGPYFNVWDEDSNLLTTVYVAGFPQAWAPDGAAPGQIAKSTPVRLVVTATGQDLFVYLNGVLVGSVPGILTYTAGTYAGFGAGNTGLASATVDLSAFSLAGVATTPGGGARVLAVSAGALSTGIAAGTWKLVSSNFNTTGIVRGQTAFGKVYLTDGDSAHYSVYDPGSQTILTWTPTVGSLPVGTADPSLAGTIMALYRGRVVLAGLSEDPQNWFMSAAGDPLDWDYGATPSAVMAVAGNNSVAGLVGDRITCLAPANDDLMVIGGDHTIWIMRGDPADGGRIDNVSNSTGIVGPDAFAFDPQSTLYFFGNGVLWRLTPDGQLTPLSRGRMDKTFGALDLVLYNMRLLWDKVRHGLHIFITPITSGASTHYFWDARTDSFWPEAYPNAHGPTAVLAFDANAANDQALLLGGQDGYVRKIDAASKTDDGTTILSRVKFPPMTPGSVHLNARLSRVITVLESSSDPVALRIFAAQSPEEVVAATVPVWSYQVSATNRYGMPRIAGNSLMFELKNDSFSATWATGHAYAVGDQVVAADGVPYVAKTAHTSTTGGAHPSPTGGGNTTDWTASAFRTWALESVNAILETAGRTRHGRI